MEKEKVVWKRPKDIVTFRTSDPKEMLGKYLPRHAKKVWTEDFVDEDTGELISIERSQVVVERGYISREKVSQIQFAIQAGDITDVEVSEENVQDITLYTPKYMSNFIVEIPIYIMGAGKTEKNRYAVRAQTIPQAIQIAAEFGQMYRGFEGSIRATRVTLLEAKIVPDDHACIPEADRTPAYERKDYFKVQVRTDYFDGEKMKKSDTYFIIAAKEVGEAKERIARLLDIMKAEREKEGNEDDPNTTRTIRKALPFEVDCVVPREFSDMFYEESTKQ